MLKTKSLSFTHACVVALLCTFLLTTSLFAQVSVSGAISGIVVDASGAVIPNAEITVTNQGTGSERQARTNASGGFIIVGLEPGGYSVKVTMQGFATAVRSGLVLTANNRLSIGNIEMSVGTAATSVEVSASAVVVNTEGAEQSAEISDSKLSDIMVRGRDFMNLIRILPGVATAGGGDVAGGTFGTASPTIGGIPNNYNNLSLDGAAAGDTDIRGSFSAGVAVDAIGEIKVLTSSYLAEIGPNPGGSVKLVTKSGTKDYHGSVYYYKRHKQFNAADFFVNRNGLVNPPYRLTTVGWTWGGPAFIPRLIPRSQSKLFFFYNTEITRSVLPNNNQQATTPTALERSGDFSQSSVVPKDPTTGAAFPGNKIPVARINAQGLALLNIFPLPNIVTPAQIALAAGQYNYQFYNGQNVPKNSHTLKLDYRANDNDTITFRPKMWRSDSKTYTGVFSFNSNVPLVYYDYYYSHDDLLLTWTHVFNPTTVNEATVSYTVAKERGNERQGRNFAGVERPTYGITLSQFHPEINPYKFIPTMAFGTPLVNPVNFNTDNRAPIDCGDEVVEFSNNLTKIMGSHAFKFGIYLTKIWSSEGLRAPSFNGNFSFANDNNNPGNAGNPFATALFGNFTSYTEASAKNIGLGYSTVQEFYAQDQWKVNSRLTLSYGARFTYMDFFRLRDGQHGSAFVRDAYDPANTPRLYVPSLVGGKRVALDPVTGATGPTVLIGGFVPGTGNVANGVITDSDITAGKYPVGWINHPPLQFAPRFGFALDVFGNGKTALRGGFGIGKHAIGNSGILNSIGFSQPIVSVSTQYYGNMSTMFSNPGTVFPSNMSAFDKNQIVPSIYNWSFGIQQALPFKTRLDVSYVGNTSRHLEQTVNLNSLPAGTRFLPQNQDSTSTGALLDNFLVPYKEYGTVNYLFNGGTSNYNSLQVKVDRQIGRGLQIGGSYTWSKAMVKNGNPNPFVSSDVWLVGLAAFDQTQILVLNYQWDLPRASKLISNSVVKAVFDDWQISGISTFAAGTPQTVGVTSSVLPDTSGSNIGARVNVVGDPNAGPRTFDKWFNTAAFAVPAKGTFGNAAINSFRGPGFNNWDLSLDKSIQLGKNEVRSLRLRVEAYNAFNHTQFNGVNTTNRFDGSGNQTNATFGQINSTRAPRVIQLSANFRF